MSLTQVETELRILQVTPHKMPQGTNWTQSKHSTPPSLTVRSIIHFSDGISLRFVILLVVVLLLGLRWI